MPRPALAIVPAATPSWSPALLAGRLVEVSGRGRLTVAFGLVIAAQQRKETVAFVAGTPSLFFPPDAADGGVDLAALVCVKVDGAAAAARAADLLLRSGAFGLVVIDLGDLGELGARGTGGGLPMPLQSRLVGLAQKHEAAVVCLTEKSEQAASLSSLVSLRAEAWRGKGPDGRLTCGVRILKDKQRGPGWGHAEAIRGPPGMC